MWYEGASDSGCSVVLACRERVCTIQVEHPSPPHMELGNGTRRPPQRQTQPTTERRRGALHATANGHSTPWCCWPSPASSLVCHCSGSTWRRYIHYITLHRRHPSRGTCHLPYTTAPAHTPALVSCDGRETATCHGTDCSPSSTPRLLLLPTAHGSLLAARCWLSAAPLAPGACRRVSSVPVASRPHHTNTIPQPAQPSKQSTRTSPPTGPSTRRDSHHHARHEEEARPCWQQHHGQHQCQSQRQRGGPRPIHQCHALPSPSSYP